MCVNDQDIKGISRHSSYGFFKLQYYMSLIILLSLFFFPFIVCLALPLWHLRSSNLLSRGVDMANHKVLGDLLHILIIEEGVEAQLI